MRKILIFSAVITLVFIGYIISAKEISINSVKPIVKPIASQSSLESTPLRGSASDARNLTVEFISRVLTSGSEVNVKDPVIRGDLATILAGNKNQDCEVTLHKDQNGSNKFGWLVGNLNCWNK